MNDEQRLETDQALGRLQLGDFIDYPCMGLREKGVKALEFGSPNFKIHLDAEYLSGESLTDNFGLFIGNRKSFGYHKDICDKVFGVKQSLEREEFLFRFVERFWVFNCDYQFVRDLENNNRLDAARLNFTNSALSSGMSPRDLSVLLGCYCLDQADRKKLVTLDTRVADYHPSSLADRFNRFPPSLDITGTVR